MSLKHASIRIEFLYASKTMKLYVIYSILTIWYVNNNENYAKVFRKLDEKHQYVMKMWLKIQMRTNFIFNISFDVRLLLIDLFCFLTLRLLLHFDPPSLVLSPFFYFFFSWFPCSATFKSQKASALKLIVHNPVQRCEKSYK